MRGRRCPATGERSVGEHLEGAGASDPEWEVWENARSWRGGRGDTVRRKEDREDKGGQTTGTRSLAAAAEQLGMKGNQGVEGRQALSRSLPQFLFLLSGSTVSPCCPVTRMEKAWQALNARARETGAGLRPTGEQRQSSQCGCRRRGVPEGVASFCAPRTRRSPVVLSGLLPTLSVHASWSQDSLPLHPRAQHVVGRPGEHRLRGGGGRQGLALADTAAVGGGSEGLWN